MNTFSLVFMCILVIISSTECHDDSTNDKYYTAAVAELKPYADWSQGGAEILRRNTQQMIEIASTAKARGADVIVFPEYGLSGDNLGEDLDDLLSISQAVEISPSSIPCLQDNNNNHTYPAIEHLSCLARDLALYLVVNICEIEHTPFKKFYNTQIVFNRNGATICRYRKKHLFFEPQFSPGQEEASESIFETDFGVTFSLMTSFDILYDEPGVQNMVQSGVKNFAMSAYWIDGLPFLTALQIFSGWATGLEVNLLVANHHIPNKGGIGSGIFQGPTNTNTYSIDSCPFLIVQNVSMESQADIAEASNGTLDRFFIHEDLSNYTTKFLAGTDTHFRTETLCHNATLCCSLNYSSSVQADSLSTYRLISYDGIVGRGGGVYEMYVQVCSVVLCLTDDLDSCAIASDTGHVFTLNQLSGTFDTEFVYPSVLNLNMTLSNIKLQRLGADIKSNMTATLTVQDPGDDILSATLYGRLFDKDP